MVISQRKNPQLKYWGGRRSPHPHRVNAYGPMDSYIILLGMNLTNSTKEFIQVDRHPFNGLFFRTILVSQDRNVKSFWILMKQEMIGWQWHQLDHMQIICTSRQMHNHGRTSSLNFFTGQILFLTQSNSVKALKVKRIHISNSTKNED